MNKTKYILIAVSGIFTIIILLCVYTHFQPYYKKYHYIAHALGGIDGLDYTNSKEALEYSYSKGFHLIEVDLSYTSDGQLVCRHNWNDDMGDGYSKDNIPDYETFMSGKVYGEYTTLDIKDIIQFAMEHSDVYFVLDIKSRNVDITDTLKLVEETAKTMEFDNLNEQFIIQFYDQEDYAKITEQFSFKNYIFSLYRIKSEIEEKGVTDIATFCEENDIKVVTIPKKYATKEICNELKEKGITVYAYTVDSMKRSIQLRLEGVDGIYTNFIWPHKILNLFLKVAIPSLLIVLTILLIVRKIYLKRK